MTPNNLKLSCPTSIDSIVFASYGTPVGSCGSYSVGTCNAANSTSIVEHACLGQSSCTIWPNTTTFGDPCFGTAKVLAVQWTCANNAQGSGVCQTGPPPAPPANVSLTVSVDFTAPTGVDISTIPSLQVVSQRLLLPWSGSIYNNSWAALRHLTSLGLQAVRFVPWIPYPRMGVAELDPPTGNLLCGPHSWMSGQSMPITLDCGPDGGTIAAVDFASWGTPSGTCGSYTASPSCDDPQSMATVQAACMGQRVCSLNPAAFNSNSSGCKGQNPYLAVQVRCSNSSAQHSYWDFTWVDQLADDFWQAVDGNNTNPIPNWSTQPSWIYDPSSFTYPQDPTEVTYKYDRGPASAASVQALGAYYGRLLSYYMTGSFTDEYGRVITRPAGKGTYTIRTYEIGNEVDYEHGYTVQDYTAEYDSIVRGIRAAVGPAAQDVKFVALNLPNIDSNVTVQAWTSYFLNSSNHAPDVWDAVQAGMIGFHGYPTGPFGPFTRDPTTFAGMFTYLDDFVEYKVLPLLGVIASSAAPAVRIALDEEGVDMDNVLAGGVAPPGDNPRFWVAGGSYWAYLWAKCAALGPSVYVVGQSQYMDAPGQEPSVTMLDWSTGLPTAKYWTLELILRTVAMGDSLVQTTVPPGSNSTVLHALGFLHSPRKTPSLLLINKNNVLGTVTVQATGGTAAGSCAALCVDESTGLGPAHSVACVPAGSGGGSSSSWAVTMMPYATCVLQW